MSVPVEVPALGESVTEAIIATWNKKVGDYVAADEILVELETDKVNVEVPAPVAGTIAELKAEVDDTVNVGDVIAVIEQGEAPAQEDRSGEEGAPKANERSQKRGGEAQQADGGQAHSDEEAKSAEREAPGSYGGRPSPAAQRHLEERGLDASQVRGSGPGGRILKEDVLGHEPQSAPEQARSEAPSPPASGPEPEERVRMSKLRQTIARRLVEATQTTAMLTTFNEVDMTSIMAMRKRFQDRFVKKYDTKVGFMSFFVKALVEGLKEFPAVNAEIDGDHIIYKNYYHIGVAVGGGRGLVVPVIRHADQMSFAELELEIQRLAKKAMDNKLTLDDLQGGTFTISNGGIYGSMLSTPILNPPQSGILGMHNILQRPVVVDDEIVARPMMYLALSYDHRIIDGKEAVSFLIRVKECLEDPERILLEV